MGFACLENEFSKLAVISAPLPGKRLHPAQPSGSTARPARVALQGQGGPWLERPARRSVGRPRTGNASELAVLLDGE